MTATTRLELTPFTAAVPQADLDDLGARLERTRFAPAAPGDSWEYGTPESHLRDMVERWKAFDWRAVEDRLNAYPQFTTEIDGQPIHLLHVRSPHPGATPLLLAHTYPGSVLDFLDMIDPLVDPVAHGGRAEDAFDVVVPSMPGFGFSMPLVGGDWTMARVARTYDTLMRGLGYDAYGIHGSDGGAMVSRELAILDPEGFLQWFQSVGAYNTMNASRPQTVAAGLADSPVATLAYHELFESFGNGTSLVRPEQVLAQATLYWLTNTYATAARYHYAEQRSGAEPVVSTGRIGVAVFKDDFQTIRSLAERDNARIEHWSEFPRGGHYAALEVPDDVVADLRAFFG